MLDVARLQVFVCVATAGSIAQAAKLLGYTPSAVSQQLSKLEREVGTTLATRTHSGIKLTAEGRVLIGHASRALRELTVAERAVRDAAEQRAAEIRLGSFASGALLLLAPTIARFRQGHPAVRLSLSEVEPPAGYDDVRTGDLDLLLTHVYPGVTPPDPEGLLAEELFDDPLVAIVPENWIGKRADGAPLTSWLAEIPMISGGPGDANRDALEMMFARAKTPPRVEFEARDYAVTMALVASGAGAAIVPRSIVSAAAPSSHTFALEPPQARRVFTLRRKTSRASAIKDFVAYLRETAAALDLA